MKVKGYNKIKILHIEDSIEDSELICFELDKIENKFDYVHVKTKDELLKHLELGKFDLVLSDYILPGFSEGESFSLCKKYLPHSSFIYVSGAISESQVIDLLGLGVDDYVLKHKLSKLKHSIKNSLEKQKAILDKEATFNRLQENEKLLQGVLDSVSSHILALDSEANIIDFNKKWAENARSNEVININSVDSSNNFIKFLKDISSDYAYADTVRKGLTKVLSGNSKYEYFDIEEFENGEIKWFTVRINPMEGTGGAILSKTNITLRKNIQEDLAEKEEWFRLLTERSSFFVCVTDLNGIIQYASPNSEKFIAYPMEELFGLDFRDLVKENYVEEINKVCHEVKKSTLKGSKNILEYELLHAKKGTIWVESSFDRFKFGAEELITITSRNITDKKLLEEEMRQYARFPKENPNPVLRVSKTMEIDFFNPAASEILTEFEYLLEDSKSSFYIGVFDCLTKKKKQVVEAEINNNWFIFTVYPIKRANYVNIYGKEINELKRLEFSRNLLSEVTKEYSAFTTDWIFFGNLLSSKLRKLLSFDALRIVDLVNKRTVFIGANKFNLKHRNLLDKYILDMEYERKSRKRLIEDHIELPFGDVQLVSSPLWQSSKVIGKIYIENYKHKIEYTDFQLDIFKTMVPQLSEVISNIEQAQKIEQKNQQLREEKKKLEEAHDEVLHSQYSMLSSQLNPHFIFNALNSIQYFVLNENHEGVFSYISNFASLMRKVLALSSKRLIFLEEEIDFLTMFLDLEKQRHFEKFDFEIGYSSDIQPDQFLIPPMILQPFIENSIIHGIAGLKEKGKITVMFEKYGNQIRCMVSDNGIGRAKAETRKLLRKEKESFSSKINKSRLDILTSLFQDDYSFSIIDKVNPDTGEGNGTTVLITLPIQLYEDQEIALV